MVSVTREVWDYLNRDYSIQNGLIKGIINLRELSTQIRKELKINKSNQCVISAIRRYRENCLIDKIKSRQSIKGSSIVMRNNISCIVIDKFSDIQRTLIKLNDILDLDDNSEVKLVKGNNILKIFIDNNSKDLIDDIPANCNVKKKLGEIKVIFDTKNKIDALSNITNELALCVPIFEIIFCLPDVYIYVEDEYLLEAHKSISRLCE